MAPKLSVALHAVTLAELPPLLVLIHDSPVTHVSLSRQKCSNVFVYHRYENSPLSCRECVRVQCHGNLSANDIAERNMPWYS